MRKIIILMAAIIVAASFPASAQQNIIGISFNYSNCEYQGGGLFDKYVTEAIFIASMPEGFKQFWDGKKHELEDAFLESANNVLNGRRQLARDSTAAFFIEVEVQELDVDGELECIARLYKRGGNAGYNPCLMSWDIDADGGSSDSYDYISILGYSRAGGKLAWKIRKHFK